MKVDIKMNEYCKNAFKNHITIYSAKIFLSMKKGNISKYTAGRLQMEKIFNKTFLHLKKKRGKELQKYSFDYQENCKPNKNIWILWFQSIENAPLVIKKCFDSVNFEFSTGWDIHLIDNNNLDKYVKFPKEIWQLRLKHKLSDASFSDLIRLYLLKHYGGLWIDASCYMIKPIPDFLLKQPIFFFQSGFSNSNFLNFQSWFLYSQKDNPIISAAYDILISDTIEYKGFKHYFYMFFVVQFIMNQQKVYSNKIKYLDSSSCYYLYHSSVNDNFDIQNLEYSSFVQKLSYKATPNDLKKLCNVLDRIQKNKNAIK